MTDRFAAAIRRFRLDAYCLLITALVCILLGAVGYRRLAPYLPRGGSDVIPSSFHRRVAVSVGRVARLVPGSACLAQALAVQWVLSRKGYAGEIHIGVRKAERGAFLAHAWLTCGGHPLIGGQPEELATFAPLTTLTSGRS